MGSRWSQVVVDALDPVRLAHWWGEVLGYQVDDQHAEVERLIDMGARHVNIGQGQSVAWVVLADPEGNEFCVLSAGASG